ncbi:hypothetical protein K9L97_01650 [Candidatus Woesearchaeota archaeon]|nr:hypothetical protein [Candidatus Woesearchaeota archaeon]
MFQKGSETTRKVGHYFFDGYLKNQKKSIKILKEIKHRDIQFVLMINIKYYVDRRDFFG